MYWLRSPCDMIKVHSNIKAMLWAVKRYTSSSTGKPSLKGYHIDLQSFRQNIGTHLVIEWTVSNEGHLHFVGVRSLHDVMLLLSKSAYSICLRFGQFTKYWVTARISMPPCRLQFISLQNTHPGSTASAKPFKNEICWHVGSAAVTHTQHLSVIIQWGVWHEVRTDFTKFCLNTEFKLRTVFDACQRSTSLVPILSSTDSWSNTSIWQTKNNYDTTAKSPD